MHTLGVVWTIPVLKTINILLLALSWVLCRNFVADLSSYSFQLSFFVLCQRVMWRQCNSFFRHQSLFFSWEQLIKCLKITILRSFKECGVLCVRRIKGSGKYTYKGGYSLVWIWQSMRPKLLWKPQLRWRYDMKVNLGRLGVDLGRVHFFFIFS